METRIILHRHDVDQRSGLDSTSCVDCGVGAKHFTRAGGRFEGRCSRCDSAVERRGDRVPRGSSLLPACDALIARMGEQARDRVVAGRTAALEASIGNRLDQLTRALR